VPLARRLLAPLAAVAVVVIVIVLLIVINGHNPHSNSTAAPAATPTGPLASVTPTPTATKRVPRRPPPTHASKSPTPTKSPRTHPTHTSAPPQPPNTAMASVVVLNNSRRSGLAHQVAAEVEGRGWQIAQVGNLQGLVAQTTVYYAAGDAAAAQHLASEFGSIQRVAPDSEGRIHEPGLTLVVTRFWAD
jgi:type IV secretory pathway VirB10-like protein